LYLLNELECKLPWQTLDTTHPTCNKVFQYDKLLNITLEVENMGEMDLYKRTGCLPSCHRREFDTKITTTKSTQLDTVIKSADAGGGTGNATGTATKKESSSAMIMLYYAGSRYKKKVEYLTFGLSDLYAAVGGYMGLLLGYSFLSVYDISKIIYKKLLPYCMKKSAM
jgi:hypothetical protein